MLYIKIARGIEAKSSFLSKGAVLSGFGEFRGLKINCCDVWHSTTNPKTYNNFDKYEVKPLSKSYVGKDKVYSEMVFVLHCPQSTNCINNGVKVEIIRYGKIKFKKKIIERESYSGLEAIEYLKRTVTQRILKDIPCPVKHFLVAKKIPWSFPKVMDETTVRKRYLNEQGWADKWGKGIIVEGKWKPDEYKSEVKIYSY